MSIIKEYSTEIKVGALAFASLVLGGIFLWALGDYTPIGRTYNIYATYQFAGGVELGTPVRVSGIKVGKVTNIEFLTPAAKTAPSGDVALKLKLSISKTVRPRVRRDSKFFINQAGIIGERYIEITAGSAAAPEIKSGETVRGIDPPRFDEMLSQNMDVFGKVADILDRNREGIQKTADSLAKAGEVLSKLVDKLDDSDIEKLRAILERTDKITADLEVIAGDLKTDLGPTMSQVRGVLSDARPVLETANSFMKSMEPVVSKADKLLSDIDSVMAQVNELPDEDKEKMKEMVKNLADTATQLQNIVARLDAFTAMVEKQYPDLDREKLVSILRTFFQKEGIKINVGEVKFRSKKK